MHTTARKGWRLHFNSDLSGEAVLQVDDSTGFVIQRLADTRGEHTFPIWEDLHFFYPGNPGAGPGLDRPARVRFPAELLLEFQARALESAAEIAQNVFDERDEQEDLTLEQAQEDAVEVIRQLRERAAKIRGGGGR